MEQLKSLKEQVAQFRQENPHRGHAFPKSFWDEVASIAHQFPTSSLAEHLGINSHNLARQLKRRKKKNLSPKASAPSAAFLEIPQNLLPPTKGAKQVTIQLPHGISLSIDL